MTLPLRHKPTPVAVSVLRELEGTLSGDVHTDALSRAIYATDASIYEIVPDVVITPRRVSDVAAAVRACAKLRVPITARGAGTGLAGGAVNRGVQLDCSRHLNRILEIDPARRIARAEPGVVLDELNARLAPHGLHFAPDVATSSRATIGGMIANNSCGAHSIIYGRTVDHTLGVDVVLSDGSVCTWGAGASDTDGPLAKRCEEILREVSTTCMDEIKTRYPKVLRRNGGYALDRLHVEAGRINPETIICGSEGTLAIVVGATLKLTPLPAHRGLVVAHFKDLLESLEAAPTILEHGPAAIELLDRMILDAAMSQPVLAQRGGFIEGEPEALLVIELFGKSGDDVRKRLIRIADDLRNRRLGYAWPVLTGPVEQENVWEIRKRGLGLLMSRPGDAQPYAFVEDTAVDPTRLREYIERFAQILTEAHVEEAGYYAHASVGCLHVRPVLNLKRRNDVERMRRIADRVSSLALEFGGTMTGEHGDGLARSCWLEKMYGPRIIEVFGKVKRTFDPEGILNPGKIVSPLDMTEHLRYGESFCPTIESNDLPTALDFTAHGGMLGLAGMCSGVGQCRQRLVGTMCPSYMATSEEKHTTRARANALRMALSNRGLLDGLADPALDEVMDLCLSCKACKAECPTGVDMAALKAEWLWQQHRANGAPLRNRLIAAAPKAAAVAGHFPALANAMLGSRWMRATLDRFMGIDRRMPLPRLAKQSFRQWFANHRRQAPARDPRTHGTIIYFCDTWTNHFTPQVGMAAVRFLEALGYRVIVPPTACCGRPAISKGLLGDARRSAEQNVAILTCCAPSDALIVGTEPSCVSAILDEWPQLLRTSEARRITARTQTIESFLARVLRDAPDALRFDADAPPVVYHGHCHQKALTGTADPMFLLNRATNDRAREVNSGCCGMAGSFGHEAEHYEVARDIGEQRLFPAVRSRGDAEIVVSSFSCRHQIAHHTGAAARHVVELLSERLI